jgi:hypothetical protein
MIWWLVGSTTTKKDLIAIPGWLAICFVSLVDRDDEAADNSGQKYHGVYGA